MNVDPDVELMLRVKQGDEEAFDALMEKHRQPVYNFVFRQVGNEADAEDIAQHVFVQVYRSAARYEPSARFTTWIFTIARNLCLNEFRRRRNHPAQSLDAPAADRGGGESPPVQYPDARAKSPAAECQENELQERILRAVDRLPENQRTAILLCCIEDLPYEEIARVLNTSVSATKSLIHRARETLRAEFNG
ncbi:MAG: RNA polymerase sigma factor [Verrucomicrobiae bacterium]|nr:RNA polymerase sigma factor [Verrucomicrobiae bacterium]